MKEHIKQAVESDDWRMVGAISDHLRDRGFNYEKTMQFFEECGCCRHAVEGLLYTADTCEALEGN